MTTSDIKRTIKTVRQDRGRWKDFGEYSLHNGEGVINVNPHYKKVWVEHKEDNWFNSYQYFLLRRCLFGLEVYSKEEVEYMHKEKVKRVTHVHQRSMEVLNLFRQRVIIYITNRIFRRLFATAAFFLMEDGTNILEIEYNAVDPEFNCYLSYSQLGITKKMIACELVAERCLPWEFFDLTVKDDPRLIRLKKPSEPIDSL